MARTRSSKGILFSPANGPTHSAERRRSWLAAAEAGFASTQPSNRTYYRLILHALWPEGHGIPGPLQTEEQLRAVINQHRLQAGLPPYLDVFRRLRELQGDEGFTSIVKNGRSYQLQALEIGPKREKRGRPKARLWAQLLEASDYSCAKCGRSEPEIKLSPDHRVPRSRGGTNDDENWQPLCVACNTLKSAACPGCDKACYVCFWAYPEQFKEIVINDDNRSRIRALAEARREDQSVIANSILREHFLRRP